MPEDQPLGISSYAAYELWPEVDVAIAIGTRAELPYMRWTGMMTLIDRPAPPPHLVRIDIDPVEMHRLVPHAPVVADAADGAAALLAALQANGVTLSPDARRQRLARIAGARAGAWEWGGRRIGRLRPRAHRRGGGLPRGVRR